MKNKFIRILSPITLLIVGVLDAGTILFGLYAVQKIIENQNLWNILFSIIEFFAIIIAILVSKEVISNGIKLNENEVEFTGLDENNIFAYCDIEKVETSKDTKASLKKNFVDRYSSVILTLKDGNIVTIELGLTTVKTLNKIKKEIESRII